MIFAINKDRLKQISFNLVLPSFLLLICLFYLENLFIYSNGGLIDSEEIITTLPTSMLLLLLAINIGKNIRYNLIYRNFSTFLYSIHIFL